MLLYGIHIRVITGAKMKVLEAFHHQIVRILTGKTVWNIGEEGLKWPFGRGGYRDDRAVANARICTETEGNNCGIYCYSPDLRTVNQGGEDSGV